MQLTNQQTIPLGQSMSNQPKKLKISTQSVRFC